MNLFPLCYCPLMQDNKIACARTHKRKEKKKEKRKEKIEPQEPSSAHFLCKISACLACMSVKVHR